MYTGFKQMKEPARELPVDVSSLLTGRANPFITPPTSQTTQPVALSALGMVMAEVVGSVNSGQHEEGEYS